MDLGKIRLKEDNEELDAAGIFAKTLIKKESDRIVYDVSADPDAARMNMSAFMSKVPGLKMSVRNGDLEYGHIPLEKILIDDKENDMISKSRQYPDEFHQGGLHVKNRIDPPEFSRVQQRRANVGDHAGQTASIRSRSPTDGIFFIT